MNKEAIMKKIAVLSGAFVFFTGIAYAASLVTPKVITTELNIKNKAVVETAVIRGCEDKGWVPVRANDSEFTATLNVRTHMVEVSIPYNESGYRIIYKRSKNMDYNQVRNLIHSKYIQWTENLNKSIKDNIDYEAVLKK